VVSSHFWALLCTNLAGWGHRSDRLECWSNSHVAHRSDRWCGPVWPVRAELKQLLCFRQVVCMHSSRGSCIGSGGACMCAGRALCGFLALVWWFALFTWAQSCLGCVEPLPLPKGSETCLLQVIFLSAFLWISIACWSFFLFFSFSFLSGYYMCVLSMHSSRGRLRTMCGSRTGGWSLPGVMSDWQRGVGWFLAKYCRCMLRLHVVDDVMDDFLVELQNQGRAGTMWEPNHEWRYAEATPSSRGF
jgi:hypothetical protein